MKALKIFIRETICRLTGLDALWKLLPSALQRTDYLRVQRAVALERHFLMLCETAFSSNHVRTGPCTGLVYPNTETVGSAFYPKLIGSYEAELHHEIERAVLKHPDLFIDIGFAEGYYLIGLGRKMSRTRLVGYDISETAHHACANLAAANAIPPERIELNQSASLASLSNYLPRPSLIICDCESYEEILFTRASLSLWTQSDLIIECHDFIKPGITESLSVLLATTHRVRLISTAHDRTKLHFLESPEFAGFRPAEKLRLLAEGRPGVMQWIVAEPLASTDHPRVLA